MSKSSSIVKGRILNNIHQTAQFGPKEFGKCSYRSVCRLSLSDLDKAVRDWFVTETKALDFSIKVDQVGNIFAIYPG